MFNPLSAKWPFYLSGPLLALLIILSLSFFNDNVGLSEGLTAVSEYCDDAVANRELPDTPEPDWRNLMLLGILLGAIIAAVAGKSFQAEFSDAEGSPLGKAAKTVFYGVAGGFLVMLGIQLAGDSVWGAAAAAIQLAPGGWIFLISMVLTGSTLAILLEQRGGGGSGGKSSDKAGTAKKVKSAGKKK